MARQLDFFIIGAQKGGTTALYQFLGRHPNVFLPRAKEIHFFSRSRYFSEGSEYLHSYFKGATPGATLGAAYVHAMYLPESVPNLASYRPDIKIIAVLRNPIDRAYSAYWFARQNGWDDTPTFEEAITRDAERRAGCFQDMSELTYLSHGHYAEQLAPYFERFGPSQIRVYLNEDIRDAPERVIAETLNWLGVAPATRALSLHDRINETGIPRFPKVQKALLAHDSTSKRFARAILPTPLRRIVNERIVVPLARANVQTFRYPPMDEATRAELGRYFARHNRALEGLLGRDMSHWTPAGAAAAEG